MDEKDLKRIIESRYNSVRAFALENNIPYTTMRSILERGVMNVKAETIFIEILKVKKNLTSTEVRQKELKLPKPSPRYMKVLKEETEKARTVIDNPYFKFNEEDGVLSFNKREYLLDLPKSRLYAIAKECHIPRYKKLAHWSLVSVVLKQENIQDILYQQLAKDRNQLIDEEDLEVMKSSGYVL